jgi:hypothetical protein
LQQASVRLRPLRECHENDVAQTAAATKRI